MKGVFEKNFEFFCCGAQEDQRECENFPNNGRNIGKKIADFQKPGAQKPKIEHAAQKDEGCAIQPDLSAPGPLGPDEEGGGRQDPEGEVQQRPQQGQLDPDAQDAEQVVNQPGGQPQAHRLEKSRPLGGNFRGHPPSSREKNPPRPRSVSS